MNCAFARELVSADLDGELAGDERRLLDQHLGRCAECQDYAEQAGAFHRSFRVHVAPPVPDLTAAVLARSVTAPAGAAERPRSRSRRPRIGLACRVGLAAVGATQLAL